MLQLKVMIHINHCKEFREAQPEFINLDARKPAIVMICIVEYIYKDICITIKQLGPPRVLRYVYYQIFFHPQHNAKRNFRNNVESYEWKQTKDFGPMHFIENTSLMTGAEPHYFSLLGKPPFAPGIEAQTTVLSTMVLLD